MASVASTSRRCGNREGLFPRGFTPFSASEIKNIGLLGHKPRNFVGKTSALCPEEVRCFRLSIPCFSSFFPRFSPHFREKPPRNSSFSSRRHPSRCAPPSFFATKRPFPLREGPPCRVIRILGACPSDTMIHPCSLPTAHTASAPHSLHLRPSPADSCNVSATA